MYDLLQVPPSFASFPHYMTTQYSLKHPHIVGLSLSNTRLPKTH